MRLILSSIVFIATVTTVFGAKACTLIYSPVCGSDGITYANRCFLDAASSQDPSITFVKNGKCNDYIIVKREVVEEEYTIGDYKCPEISKQGACTLELYPVCASNGKTYPNRCGMCIDMYKNGKKLTLVHEGECESNHYCLPQDKLGRCTREYRPVCGSDGKTYANRCTFCYEMYRRKEEFGSILTAEHDGKCEEKQDEFPSDFCLPHYKNGICNRMYAPVCGDDGQTYGNTCEFCYYMYKKQEEGVQLMPAHYGECEDKPSYNSANSVDECLPHYFTGICTREYAPICGSDGITHDNFCVFCYDQHQRYLQTGKNITITHYGECEEEQDECINQPNNFCPAIYEPVCATDGKTYANPCLLCAEKRKLQENGVDAELNKVHNGECEKPTYYEAEFCRPQWKSGVCTKEYMPICGSDGKTYGNRCTFCYAMYKRQESGNDLRVKRDGECQDEDVLVCPEHYKHTNVCTLEYSPICGYDGRTYPNECSFCSAQAKKKEQGIELDFFYHGHCYV